MDVLSNTCYYIFYLFIRNNCFLHEFYIILRIFSNNLIYWHISFIYFISTPPPPQQVTDRTCLRALEKIKNQLEKGSKELDPVVAAQDQAQDINTTTALQNEDGN